MFPLFNRGGGAAIVIGAFDVVVGVGEGTVSAKSSCLWDCFGETGQVRLRCDPKFSGLWLPVEGMSGGSGRVLIFILIGGGVLVVFVGV